MTFTLREDLERAIEKHLRNKRKLLLMVRDIDWSRFLARTIIDVVFETISLLEYKRGRHYLEPVEESMSAIISGWKCKDCKQKYWISLGHPKWYDDVVKKGEPKNESFELFEDIQKSGRCLTCYMRREKLL